MTLVRRAAMRWPIETCCQEGRLLLGQGDYEGRSWIGSPWMELQMAINVLMIAHYFTLEVSTLNYKLHFNPLPSLAPSNKLKFLISAQKRELPA